MYSRIADAQLLIPLLPFSLSTVNLGKWVIANLFEKFIEQELKNESEGNVRYGDDQPNRPESVKSRTVQTPGEEKSVPEPAVPAVPSISIPPPAPLAPNVSMDEPKFPRLAVTTNAADQSPFLPSSPQAAQFAGPFTAPPSSNPQSDYFSGAHHTPVRRESSVQLPPPAALPTSPTSPTSGNFMNRLKNLSVKAKLSRVPTNELPGNELLAPTLSTTSISASTTPTEETTQPQQPSPQAQNATLNGSTGEPKPTEENNKLKDIEESKSESYTPPHLEDFPPLEIPSSTMIIVAEESAEASTGIDLYRGTVGSVGEDASTIIDVAPSWLLSYLLYVSRAGLICCMNYSYWYLHFARTRHHPKKLSNWRLCWNQLLDPIWMNCQEGKRQRHVWISAQHD